MHANGEGKPEVAPSTKSHDGICWACPREDFLPRGKASAELGQSYFAADKACDAHRVVQHGGIGVHTAEGNELR